MASSETTPKTLKASQAVKSAANTQPRVARLSPDQRREQLLACALKVFAEHGLGAANHGLIAVEAQVSVPTVFFYFNTRDALVDAVLSEVERFFGSNLDRVVKDTGAANLALIQFSRAMVQALETHPYHSRIFLEWSIAVRAEIWPRYLKLHQRIVTVLSKLIARGQTEGNCRPELIPEDEAQLLHAASYALAQMKLTGAPPGRIERFEQSILQTVLTVLPPAQPL